MSALIKGVTHVCIKCSPSELSEIIRFYHTVLGLPIECETADGIMFSAGNCSIEVFTDGGEHLPTGAVRHFAFEVNSADDCVKAVSDAGYEVFIPARDGVIESQPPLNIRYAFCYGPVGEEVEFFEVK